MNSTDPMNYTGYSAPAHDSTHLRNNNLTISQNSHSQLDMNSNNECLVRVSNSDGSDGYGSDPSRCSAFLPTPQRSPTPSAIMVMNNSDKTHIVSNNSPFPQLNPTIFNVASQSQPVYENRSSSVPTTVSDSLGNFTALCSNENEQVCNCLIAGSNKCPRLKLYQNNPIPFGKQRHLSMPTNLFPTDDSFYHPNSSQLKESNVKSTPIALHSGVVITDFHSNQWNEVENEKLFRKYCHFDCSMKGKQTITSNLDSSNHDGTVNGKRVIPIICFEKASTPSISEATISEDEQEYQAVYKHTSQPSSSSCIIKAPSYSSSMPIPEPTHGKYCTHLKIPKHKTPNWTARRPPWPYKTCSHHYKSPGIFKTGHSSNHSIEDNSMFNTIHGYKHNKTNHELIEQLSHLIYRINKLENENYILQNSLFNQSNSIMIQQQQQHQVQPSLPQQKWSPTVNLTRQYSLPIKSTNVYQHFQDYLKIPNNIQINDQRSTEYDHSKDIKFNISQSNIHKNEENLIDESNINNNNNNNCPVFTLD